MSFTIIAAVGKNRELGKNGKLLWRLPGDQAFFKKTTMGHSILMGRKTFESLPGLLPGRKHIVVTRKETVTTTGAKEAVAVTSERGAGAGARGTRDENKASGAKLATGKVLVEDKVEIVHDLSDFIARHKDDPEEIFVIGGGMVYFEMLRDANKLILTEVEAEDPAADTFFPEFDKSDFEKKELGKGQDNGINYTFCQYLRK